MKAARWFGLTAVLASASLLPTAATAEEHLTDGQVQQVVEHALLEKDVAGVGVSVDAGTVTLRGMVASAWARDEAEKLAVRTRDARGVVNKLAVAAGESDAAIAAQVARKIRRYVLYSVFDDVRAVVEDGTVTIEGEVTMGFKAADIARLVSKVEGVQEVRNLIRTLRRSPLDDQIRVAVASHIYSDPVFEAFAFEVDPPIHVVVENGNVTLTGAVGSPVERLKAEIDARDVFGVMGVENHLQVTK